jgi:hypothetical protein
MKITGKVLNTAGKVHTGFAAVVVWQDEQLATVGSAKITKGKFTLEPEQELGPVWGLLVDGQPALVSVEQATKESFDLGTLQLLASPIEWSVFHAPEGKVMVAPVALASVGIVPDVGGGDGEPTTPPVVGPKLNKVMKLSDVLDNASTQLDGGASAGARKKFLLQHASLTLKGVATSLDGDQLGIEFPPSDQTPGANLSEVSFSFKPNTVWLPPEPSDDGPPPVQVPFVTGYTRELATRKLTAAGFTVEVNHEIVFDAARAGTVIRQLPSGTVAATSAHGRIRIFIGKLGEI